MVVGGPNGAPNVQHQMEERYRNGKPEREEDGPRGSVEVQVSLGWLQDEVGDRREGMMQAHGPGEDVWNQEPPSRVAQR